MSERRPVLIVEDEAVVLKVSSMALTAHGIEPVEAPTVDAAKALLERQAFPVVLSDLKLPGASGFDLLRHITRTDRRCQVIIITGYATIENALESFQLGSFDFLPKPFDTEELVSVVDRALRYFDRRQEDAPARSDRSFLGRHSWVSLDADGSATVGVGETLALATDAPQSIDCLQVGNHTTQGECCCTLSCKDGFAHRVWAPLSGEVLSVNPKLENAPELIQQSPLDEGWLLRIIPSDLDQELVKLSRPIRKEGGVKHRP